MAASATYVDLVKVVALTDDFEVGTRTPADWAIWIGTGADDPKTIDEVLQVARTSWRGVRIHYQIIDPLKGGSSEAFTMDGERPAPWMNGARAAKLADLKHYLDQQDLVAWPGPGACLNEITAVEGAYYLVFRDAERGLLRSPVNVTFRGGLLLVPGPANVPVAGPTDPWVTLVREALRPR